ncbi:MAG: undecaprenyl-diphosphatase [Ectobacillus sp.]
MDYIIFKIINQLAGRFRLLDTIMIAISQKARYFYILVLAFMWFRNNAYKKITLYTALSTIVTLLINSLIKLFYFKPRPFLEHYVRVLPPHPPRKSSSFPSKHTALAFAAATSVLFYKRLLGRMLWLLAFLSGFSRIWMGHHYPADVMGSALLGSLAATVVNLAAQMRNFFIRDGSSFFCHRNKMN